MQNFIGNKERGTNKQESVKKNKNKVLKRKLTEDGLIIERELSEGEASSGFETVSSIDSKLDFEDIQLSSSDDEQDYNVIVRIKNDLAYPQNRDSYGRRYWKGRSNIKIRNNSRSERFLGKYPNPRHGIFRNYKRSEHWKRDSEIGNEGAHQRYGRRDIWPREDNDFLRSRRKACCDREWSKCSDHSKRSRGSGCSDRNKRSRESISNDGSDGRPKNFTTVFTGVSRDSSERNYRFVGSKSSNYKATKRESRRSRSIEKSRSSANRSLTCARQTSFSKSPSTSVWKRLDNDGARERIKKDMDRSSRSPSAGHPRKKERTPFLVELERKLKEAEKRKSIRMADLIEKDQSRTPAKIYDAASAPEAVESLNPILEHRPNYTSPPNNPGIYSARYPSIPTLSVDNLPLVPGPTGLPVHVTATGEQIPHDMDGRRIPVSPNGYYLPLDPTGRLYPHIVSPGNQAVPIHMSEDGILRLPNLEPVPYGPSHNHPVNIDGNVILMGPDSRPLYPCPNLPRQPPSHLMHMTQFNADGDWQTKTQQVTSATPQTPQTEDKQTFETIGLEEQYLSTSNPRLQSVQSCLQDFIQTSHGEANKADLLMNYQKRARERKEDVLKCKEIEKNLGVSPSRGGVKRSVPKKLSQKKTLKDEFYGEYDLTLDSSDSDSASASNPSPGTKKGCLRLTHEGPSNSGGAQNVSPTVCDNEKYTEPNVKDFISKKIQQALKSLDERGFEPPALGRFIISEVPPDILMETSSNASPLLRNRVKLPFLTPNSDSSNSKNESKTAEKTRVTFSFLAQGKSSDKREKAGKSGRAYRKNFNSTKSPVFTFDFAVQCDFTSSIIKNLNTKISGMEMEVVRLRNINANLLDGFRNVHEANEKKSEELRKALLEIDRRNNEIVTLKRLISERGK